ncbi:MAG: hypothetical protein IT336_04350 [Thermomicrobiales bacterium]|nr:hypothetical protein [Thermomicrobiales bacterium]
MRGGGWSRRAYLLTAVAVVIAFVSAIAPDRTLADSLNAYESDEFGYRIEWDEEIWNGELDEGDGYGGISFDSITSYGGVVAYYAETDDARSCLADIVEPWAKDDGTQLEDFGVARARMERPEPMDGAEAELYTYTFVGSGDADLDQVLYVSCLPILDGEAAIQIVLATTPDVYDDVWTEWDDLIAGVTVDEPSNSRTSNRDRDGNDVPSIEIDAELTDGRYENDRFGLAITWDEDLWRAEEVAENDGSTGVILNSGDSYLHLQVNAQTFETADECLENVNDTFLVENEIEDFDVAPRRMERPELGDGVAGDLYTFWNPGIDDEMVIFNGCQLLDDGYGFSIQMLTLTDEYDAELPYWQEVIDGIQLGERADATDKRQPGEGRRDGS